MTQLYGSKPGNSERGPARICALVINSVSHDSRVLKQADSLADAGYDVTIVGVKDVRNAVSEEWRPSGVRIRRVGWRAAASRRMGIAIASATVLAAVALVALSLALPYDAVGSYLSDRYFLPVLLYAAVALIAWQGARYTRKSWASARRYRAIEYSEDIEATPLSMRGRLHSWLAYLYKSFNWSRAMKATIKSVNPDVVHCHDVLTLPLGAGAKRYTGCRLVYDAHEIYEEVAQNEAETAAVYRSLQQRYTPRVDAFITINESIGEFYSSHYQELPKPVIIKNAAIPANSIRYDGRLHSAAGLSANQRILLYQGGFAPCRGLEVLVDSSAHLGDEWTLVMMGWGSLEEDLRERARGVEDSRTDRASPGVSFVPGVEQQDLPNWTAGATVGVIPYEHVGLNHWFCSPNKLWEYPNAAVPMLVSPFPEMAKVVESYGIGWLLPEPLETSGIARVLAELEDQEIERARAACARFIAEDNWFVYARRLCDLYSGLVTGYGADSARPEKRAMASTEE